MRLFKNSVSWIPAGSKTIKTAAEGRISLRILTKKVCAEKQSSRYGREK